MQNRVGSLANKTQPAGGEEVDVRSMRIQLLTPVNPLADALLKGGDFLSRVTDAEFEAHRLQSQAYTLGGSAKVRRVYHAASCLEFVFTQSHLTGRYLELLYNLQSDSLFFERIKNAVAFSNGISEGYDRSGDRELPMLLAKRRELVTFRINAQTQIEKRRALQVKKWMASLSARFLEHHRKLLVAFLGALSPFEGRLIVIAKGIEVYFPGLGKDLDLYIGIDERSDSTEEQGPVMERRFIELLQKAGFLVSMVVGSQVGHAIISQFQVKHPDHPCPLDIAIRPLPPALSAVFEVLKVEWVFDIASGFIPLRLDAHGAVEAGALLAPPFIREAWIYSEEDTLPIDVLKTDPLQIHELAFLCKICCKLQIDLKTGESRKALKLVDRRVRFRLSPALLESLQCLEKTPEVFSKVFFKILGCYFSARSLEFHTFFCNYHWVERLFPGVQLEATVTASLQKLLKNTLPGLAYFVFLSFHFLRNKVGEPVAMEQAFCELLFRHCGYDRRDLLLIFRSLSQRKIVGEVLKDSFVEMACKSLSLSRLDPSAPEFTPPGMRSSLDPSAPPFVPSAFPLVPSAPFEWREPPSRRGRGTRGQRVTTSTGLSAQALFSSTSGSCLKPIDDDAALKLSLA